MENCRFEGNCPPDNAYLGRPWREYAKTVLINCYIGDHICREGWHDWNKEGAHKNAFYAEYGSYGPKGGMDHRPDWIYRLKELILSNIQRMPYYPDLTAGSFKKNGILFL